MGPPSCSKETRHFGTLHGTSLDTHGSRARRNHHARTPNAYYLKTVHFSHAKPRPIRTGQCKFNVNDRDRNSSVWKRAWLRKRIRTTSGGGSDILAYKNAYDEVKLGASLKQAAEKHGVNYVSLLRYKRKPYAVN
ncbi:unnamed protein product [Diatraea saccharalis]|uniref:Uncharacterized protein n=1 Tax=Diatraea saccharalis TaxID=40085 RepID=A0A9N9R817_9NEOP|nr:unnamed protein product [Diatraea saccharalis]